MVWKNSIFITAFSKEDAIKDCKEGSMYPLQFRQRWMDRFDSYRTGGSDFETEELRGDVG